MSETDEIPLPVDWLDLEANFHALFAKREKPLPPVAEHALSGDEE